MSRLIWSSSALLDVKRLYDFLKPKNLDAAKRAVKAIRQGVKVLAEQSGVGRPVEEMDEEFRDWIIDFGDAREAPKKHWYLNELFKNKGLVNWNPDFR